MVPREELYAVVWQQPYRRYERSVDVYVAKLRQKLEEAAPDWRYIHTHFGFGYRFDAQPLAVAILSLFTPAARRRPEHGAARSLLVNADTAPALPARSRSAF